MERELTFLDNGTQVYQFLYRRKVWGFVIEG